MEFGSASFGDNTSLLLENVKSISSIANKFSNILVVAMTSSTRTRFRNVYHVDFPANLFAAVRWTADDSAYRNR